MTTETTRFVHRQEICSWLRDAWKHSGKTMAVLSELMGRTPTWLAARTATAPRVSPTMEEIEEMAALTGYPVTGTVRLHRDALGPSTRRSIRSVAT